MNCIKFKKTYQKIKNTYFFKGIKEIKKLEPKMLQLTILYGIISAIYPFISIYGVSVVIDDLSSENNSVYIHIVLFLTVNTFFYTLNNLLHRGFFNSRRILFIKEKEAVTKMAIYLREKHHENKDLNDLLNKENAIIKHQSNNPLFMICKLLFDFVSGFSNIILTFLIVSNLFIINDSNHFISSGYFSIIIIIITLCMIILVGFASALISKRVAKANKDLLQSLTKFDYYWDYFNDFETGKSIRIFNGSNFIIKSIKRTLSDRTFLLLDKKGKYMANQGISVAVAGSLLAFFVYLVIGYKCYIGLFSIGELTRYISGFMQIIQGGMLIANGVGQILYLNSNLKYYFQLVNLNNARKIKQHKKTQYIDEIVEIEFKNVSYKYKNSENFALSDINLKIRKNEKIAIVGENGAGKTTFIKLLLGFYEPSTGEILVNGIDLKTIKFENYIKNFSTMFQDFFLPGFTINEILTGNSNQICSESVLSASNCTDFLKNHDLNKDFVGNEYNPKGINFSGGEKQKLAYARALNKNCEFYILDEPSSAMDAISEYRFYNGLNKYLKNKSIIYISHRLFSCAYADRILVFQNGMLMEDDKFKCLLSNHKSKFYELWNKESSQYRKDII